MPSMTGCAHVREELGAYVLGALEPDEHDAVARAPRECADVRAPSTTASPALPALLAHADGLEIPPPPPALEERVLDRGGRERGPRRRPHRRPRFACARALVGGRSPACCSAPRRRRSRSSFGGDGDAGARSRRGRYRLVLRGTRRRERRAPSSSRAAAAPRSTCGSRGLPPGGKAVYEVRCEGPRWSASAGTFRADDAGPCRGRTSPPRRASGNTSASGSSAVMRPS